MARGKRTDSGKARTRKPAAAKTATTREKTSKLSEWRNDSTRRDGWGNVMTQLGDPSRDRRLSNVFVANIVSSEEARELWRGNDLAARIIEEKPQQAFRPGWEIRIASDDKAADGVDADKVKKTIEAVQTRLEDLKAKKKLIKAAQFARAYGGGAIYPVINDSSPALQTPLAERGRISGIKHLHVFESTELRPETYYTDLSDPKFGCVETYRLTPRNGRSSAVNSNVLIHESRLIVFNGIEVSNQQHSGAEPGWGDSCLTRCAETLSDFGASWGYAAHLISDFAQGVLKMAGLADLMAQNGEKVVAARIAQMDAVRSVLRSLVIDAEDDFQRQTTPLTGLPDMMQLFATRLAAAADMPVTVLMGISPAGLNATGESDIRNWYDKIAAEREEEYLDQLERLVQLVFLSNDGPTKGVEPKQWSCVFNPLYQQSEKERLDSRAVQKDIDVDYINAGVYTADEVARNRFGGDTFSYDMTIDWKERERLAKELEAEERAALEEMASIAGGASPANENEEDPDAPDIEDDGTVDTPPPKAVTSARARANNARARAAAGRASRKVAAA